MTSPTKPVAWTGRSAIDGKPVFAMPDEPRSSACSPWIPLYTATQLQAAREEGCRKGIEAAGKEAVDEAETLRNDGNSSDEINDTCSVARGALLVAADRIHALQPETVLKEYGK